MSNTVVALTATEQMRSWVYSAMCKDFTPARCLTILASYGEEMTKWATENPTAENAATFLAVDRPALRVLYAEVKRIAEGGWPDGSEAADRERQAESRRQTERAVARERAAAEVGPDQGRGRTALPNGIFSVPVGSSRVTVRLTEDWRADAPAGSQVAQVLTTGSKFDGFAFVSGRTGRVWRRKADDARLGRALDALLSASAETAAGWGNDYAVSTGRCWRCNRVLRVPASVHAGLGPDCAKKVA